LDQAVATPDDDQLRACCEGVADALGRLLALAHLVPEQVLDVVIGQARAQLVEPTVERLLAMGDHGHPSDPGDRLIVAYLRSTRPVDCDCAGHAGS
jgi:hypothetical protein